MGWSRCEGWRFVNGCKPAGPLDAGSQLARQQFDVQPLVQSSSHFISATPRSRQIFLAKSLLISKCLGTADRLLEFPCCHHEWREPSRKSSQPCDRRYAISSCLFIWQLALPYIDHQPPKGILPVEFQSFSQRHPETCNKLFSSRPLGSSPRHLLDPADPPLAVLLDHRRVFVVHVQTSIFIFFGLTPWSVEGCTSVL